jgi:hypothetical protein
MDWGLVTSVRSDLQGVYIEHIAHLVSRDYAEVPDDLVKLGFVGKGQEAAVREQGVVDTLADIYGKWAMGGGAAKVDVGVVVTQLTGLTKKYGNFFRLPPYFAYVARAFGVLEGIGLQANPDYAIVGECLPYIAQRIITGKNADSKRALESFIYGKEKDKSYRVLDAERIQLLIEGLGSYQSTTAGVIAPRHTSTGFADTIIAARSTGKIASPHLERERLDQGLVYRDRDDSDSFPLTQLPVIQRLLQNPTDRVKQIDQAAEQFVNLVIDGSNGPSNPLQGIIIEELAKIFGAYTRKQWHDMRLRSGKLPNGRSTIDSVLDPLGIFSNTKLVNPDDDDERLLDSYRSLLEMVGQQQSIMAEISSGGAGTSFAAGSVEEAAAASRESSGQTQSRRRQALENNAVLSFLMSLEPEETVQLAAVVTEKLWRRRSEVAALSRTFARSLVKQALSRM